MKLRVLIKNNKYIPQWLEERSGTWHNHTENDASTTKLVIFDNQVEAETFISNALREADKDYNNVVKVYKQIPSITFRVVLVDNKYEPQCKFNSPGCDEWIGWVSDEVVKTNISITTFNKNFTTFTKAELFILDKIKHRDPDFEYTWKTYES